MPVGNPALGDRVYTSGTHRPGNLTTRDTGGTAAQAAVVQIESQPLLLEPIDVTLDVPLHRALVTDGTLPGVVAVDLTSGARTILSSASVGTGPGFLFPQAITLDGSRALVTDQDLAAVVAVDRSTGNRTILSGTSVGTGPRLDGPTGISLGGSRALVIDGAAVVAIDLRFLQRARPAGAHGITAGATGPRGSLPRAHTRVDATRPPARDSMPAPLQLGPHGAERRTLR